MTNVWDETIASRGAEENASCLLKYCREKALAGVTSLQAYSDACGGQNRNYNTVTMTTILMMCVAFVRLMY